MWEREIKVVNQLTLKQGDYSGVWVRPNVFISVLNSGRGRVRDVMMESGPERCYFAGLEDGGRGLQAEECGWPL